MIGFAVALVVVIAAACEFVAWLRYPGGGNCRVTEEEIRRIEEEIAADDRR